MNLYTLVGDTYFASFDCINNLISKQSNLCPGESAEQWIRFSPDTFVTWLNRETGLIWDTFKLYHDGIAVNYSEA